MRTVSVDTHLHILKKSHPSQTIGSQWPLIKLNNKNKVKFKWVAVAQWVEQVAY